MSVDSVRHAEIKRLFGEALEKGERWLEIECGDDAALLAEVRALLQADAEDAPACPDRVGEFRIRRRIGEGGMGTVYEAEQESPRRLVALKVMAPFLVDEESVRRFRYETEILGQLDHPGIAKIHAAGIEAGRPWFAMELVDGSPLNEYVEDHSLTPRERLALLQRVCEAVQHAHGRGVVHRDLKPANVLVDRDGNPKLLDFGVAKLVDGEARMTTLATLAGQLLGTVPYMAPEQIAGDPLAVDPRSDVYALGVIGYELLTGRPLHDLAGKSLPESLAQVQKTEAPRLGTVNTRWRGDVETIVAKALAKERERRYDSAGELAADIARYLRDEPIVARPPTASYHFRKFVRRHRALVASLAAIFLTLLGGAIVATTFYFEAEGERRRFRAERNEAQRQRARADREAERAKAERELAVLKAATANEALDFLVDVFRVEDPFRGRDEATTTREVLERASTRIRERLGDEPELQTELARTLGRIYGSIGNNRRAAELYALALKAARRGDRERPILLALDHLAGALVSDRRFDEAEPVLRELMERAQAGQGPAGALPAAMQKTAMLLDARNRPREAEALFRKALAAEDAEAGQIATISHGLAKILRRYGRFEEALQVLEDAAARAVPILGPESSDHLELLNAMAVVYTSMERHEEALALYRRIEEEFLTRLDPHEFRAIVLRIDIGRSLTACKKYAEAIALLEDCLAHARSTLGETHPNFGAILATYVDARVKANRLDGLEPLARELVESERPRAAAEGGWRLGGYLLTLGNVLMSQGKANEALPHYEEALGIVRKSPGLESVPGSSTLIFALRAYLSAGKYAEGKEIAETSLAVQRKLFGEKSANYAMAAYHLGIICWKTGEPERAETLLREARELLRTVGPESMQMLGTLRALDHLAAARGRADEALALAKERLAISKRACVPTDPKLGEARARVAELSRQ